jgi:hydroxysqualene dehydroxylase
VSAARVVVIGGGLAGISAALTAADAGARVVLLERRPRLGGATFSIRRDGLTVDNGQHVFTAAFSAYRRLLERLGVTSLTTMQDRLHVPVLTPGGGSAVLRRAALPAPLHLAAAITRYRVLSPADRLRAARAGLALRRLDPSDPELDGQSFGAWLAANGQRPAAIAALWELLALPALNLPVAEASLALAVHVFRAGLLDDPRGADLGWGRVPLDELHAGPAAAALAVAGAQVRTGVPVQAIGASADGSLTVATPDGPVEADAVILAVPHDAAGTLLPVGAIREPARLRQLGTSPIVDLHVVFDRPVTRHPLAAGLGTPVQWVFDRTEAAGLRQEGPRSGGGTGPQYLAVSLSAAAAEIDMPTNQLRDRYLPALRALFPAAGAAQVLSFMVTRERAATFRQAPGVAALRPGARTAIPGLYLAGAWTATGWPATMEGAVRSGLEAASEALAALGRPIRKVAA